MSGEADTQSFAEELAAGEYDYVELDALNEHPKNTEVYGEIDLDKSFVEDIKRNGIETPLVVNEHEDCPNTVIGGHRRLEAAKDAGLNRVPVRWVSYPEPLATRRLILNNKQRDKTPAQQSREALILEDTAREIGQAGQGQRTDLSPNLEKGDFDWAEDVGEQIGVSKNTVRKGTDVFRMAYPDQYVHDDLRNPEKYDVSEDVREVARQQVEAMDAGEQSFHGAYEEIQQAEREIEEEEEQQRLEVTRKESYESDDETLEIHEGDFSEVLDDFEDESFDHIVTDPPYDEDAMDAWRALAENAERVLKPGGYLIAYSGKFHLPEVFRALEAHLEYYWQVILVHDSPGAKFFARKMRTNYKPILIFAKPPVEPQEDFVVDVIQGAGREKDDHEWQQAEAESAEILEQFTNINDRILDPMCGSGTVGVACKRLDRRCVLIDEDPDAISKAREKCKGVE